MKTDQKLNMTMLCDFYELTMGNGYLKAGFQDRITYFDVYFRSVPDGGGYAIAAGLDQLIEEKTGITTMVAEDPLTAVAIGTGKFIEFQHGDKKEQEFN